MIRPLELFIGLRYTRAKRRNHFISFISFVSIIGIFLGVAVLITVLSVMNGFGKELRDNILGVVSHLTITQSGQQLKDWQSVTKKVEQYPEVTGAAPYVLGQGMLVKKGAVKGIMVRGIVPEREKQVSELHNSMRDGKLADLKPGEFGMIIGSGLTWKLDLEVGSYVSLIIPQALSTPAGIMPRFRRFKVVGVFDAGMWEYDSGLALIHMDDAATLYRIQSGASGLRLRVKDLYQAPELAIRIQSDLGFEYRTSDWTRERANLFRAIKNEKRIMLMIMFLVVVVAAFNIVSTLIMVVTDKQSDIAILRTLGLPPGSIMKVFMVQGTIIGVFGTVMGVAGGLLLSYNISEVITFVETVFNFSVLPADIYQISKLNADIYPQDVITVASGSFFISFFATLYPAWRASRVEPARALRYE
ncbi:MAG: lipoprotein-releasing ABC transporter permease subunit [Proteobacteria bacterium]|nr:lipoprotein-releasing ABC transporter permease subunit [Pseudomonadota bacterium]